VKDIRYLSINGIYKAVEGEGVNLGRPQIFVRVQGCNVRCKNCDSCSTWSFSSGSVMSLDEIVATVVSLAEEKIGWVSVTGGDPLDHAHVGSVVHLIYLLKERGFKINIEVTGQEINNEIFDLVDYISADFKTPSSGVVSSLSNLKQLSEKFLGKFQIKSIVEDRGDFDYLVNSYQTFKNSGKDILFQWVITPAYMPNEEFPRERFTSIVEWNLEVGYFSVIGQQHKWIYGPNRSNV
jgi:7-carboxy-7-deazaguanine synthase